MPLNAMVTPLSLYMLDDTIFDDLVLPSPPTNPTDYPDLYVSGFTPDRSILVDNLLMETGELNVLYPDPVFFKYAVKAWSKKELPVWQELFNTCFYKYNPLWNKDGTIKETARDLTRNTTTGSRSRTGSSEQTADDTINETEIHGLTDIRTADLRTLTSDSSATSGSEVYDQQRTGSESKDGRSQISVAGTTDSSGSTIDTSSETSGKSDVSNTTHGGGTVNETQVSAYNDSSYANRDKTTMTDTQTLGVTASGGSYTDKDCAQIDTKTEDRTETTSSLDDSSTETAGSETGIRSDDRSTTSDSDRRETGTDTTEHSGTLIRIGDNIRRTTGEEGDQEDTIGTSDGQQDHELTRTEQGNIGVTMTTQLIAAQREIVRLNIYDVIIQSFKERFCLLVY